MASVQGEINRIATAKSDIESAIEYCGVDVPNTALISTYADYIRAIPAAIYATLNYDKVGEADKYIESISQSNGIISATTGGLASTTKSGLMSKADKIKLNDIAEGADSVSFSRELTSGVKIGTITINGTDTILYGRDTWVANTKDKDGYVSAPTASNANKVWKTDSSGNPGWRTDSDTTYSTFIKSGSTAKEGLVPKPDTTAGTSKYLREDCKWVTPPNYYPKRKFDTGLQLTDTSDSTNYADGSIYVPKASASSLGVIRTNYATSGKNYKLAVNANGDAYTNVPWTDTNYYASAFSWTAGSTSGPTGTLTMQNTDDVTFPAIPSASSDASGIVTTAAQTFAGVKSFSNAVKILNGNDLSLQASSSTATDPGDVVFTNSSGSELMRLWYDSSNSTVNKRFCVRFASGTAYSVLHTGNSSVTLSGQTLTVNIGGTSKSLTNYYPTRDFSSGLKITTTSDSTNYPSGTIYVPYATTTQAGVVTTAEQEFAGKKIFTNAAILGGAGSTSITYSNAALTIGTVNRSGTANSYYPGIAFNHMYTYSNGSGWRNHAHAWIGLRLTSTSGSELSALTFATQSSTTTGSALTEHMCITPDGVVAVGTKSPGTTYKMYVNGSLYATNLYGSKLQDINTNYLLFYVGRVYKAPGGTSAYATYGMYGFSMTCAKNRVGRYIITVTNNTGKTVYLHTPTVIPVFGDWGSGSCYESPFAYLDHNYTYQFPSSVSTGSTKQFAVICGKIHTQGSWNTGDFTKSNDDGGFNCCVYATWGY